MRVFLVAGVLVLLAFALGGQPADAASSVYVMRHCARTTPNKLDGGAKGFDWYNNYTANAWPAWPDNIQPELCLPNGLTIVEGTGAWLKASGLAQVRCVPWRPCCAPAQLGCLLPSLCDR